MKFAQNPTHRQGLLKALTLAFFVLASVMPPTVLANEKATFNSTTTLQTILTEERQRAVLAEGRRKKIQFLPSAIKGLKPLNLFMKKNKNIFSKDAQRFGIIRPY